MEKVGKEKISLYLPESDIKKFDREEANEK